MKCFNQTKNILVSDKVNIAETFFTRLKGLLGRKSLDENEGLYITKCPQVHTFFMKFPIDVIFIDERGKVLKVIENLKVWRFSPYVFRAKNVIEFSSGFIGNKISIGDILEIN